MKITNIEASGLSASIRAMRHPMESYSRSDSFIIHGGDFVLGERDSELSVKLTKAGSEHRKHLRLIRVWMDVTTTRYLWQELDTYKFIDKISCSTMHTLLKNPITKELFEYEDDIEVIHHIEMLTIPKLKRIRKKYLECKENKDKKGMNKYIKIAKDILPESFLQKRTLSFNYETALTIYNQRKNHKLPQWKVMCKAIEELPYFLELTGITRKFLHLEV